MTVHLTTTSGIRIALISMIRFLGTGMFLGILAVDADAIVVAGDALAVAFAVEHEAFALDAFAGRDVAEGLGHDECLNGVDAVMSDVRE